MVQEAETGQTPPTLVLVWQPEQGDLCQQLHVTLSGIVTAVSCDRDTAVELMQQRLTPEKLGQLYDLYDRLGQIETDDFTFKGQGSAALDDSAKQAIERFAEGLLAPMNVSLAADVGVALTPLAQAAYIRFGGWSPDGHWFAYWQSTADDVELQTDHTQPPPGTLTFTNVETGEQCAMPAFGGETQAARLAWTADNRAVVSLDDATVSGLPCQPDSFTADETAVAQATATPDPQLSADGRYRVQTDILDEAENSVSLRTTMFEAVSDQPLYTVEWQSMSYLSCCSEGWVSPSQYLTNETMARPYLIDAERGVLDVPLDIFKVPSLPPPNAPGDSPTLYYVFGLPAAERDQFHLLLGLRGNFNESFPAMMFYHAERQLVETLPAGWNPWNLSERGEWISLSEEVGIEQLFPGRRRVSDYNLWARRLEDVAGEWQLIAPAVNSVFWNEDQSELAFTQNENTIVWQTFPEGEPLGRWHTDYSGRQYFSPDGRYMVTVGSIPGKLDHAILLHERDPDSD